MNKPEVTMVRKISLWFLREAKFKMTPILFWVALNGGIINQLKNEGKHLI